MNAPIILTAQLAGQSGAYLDALRLEYFPDRGYRLPAHLTLFHHLQAGQRPDIVQTLRHHCALWSPLTLTATDVLDFGGGCAFAIENPDLEARRAVLADLWRDGLTPQDARGFRPHVTVQNKVDRNTALKTLTTLRKDFAPFDIPCPGLSLWAYRGGPWDHLCDVPFGGME